MLMSNANFRKYAFNRKHFADTFDIHLNNCPIRYAILENLELCHSCSSCPVLGSRLVAMQCGSIFKDVKSFHLIHVKSCYFR